MVSVVMATYNGEKYIIKQLETIRMQTQVPDEVIICDDCSTDNTKKIVLDYIRRQSLDGWYFYSNNSNLGFYDNFFRAISLAKGDTIYLSDQDDIWDLGKIRIFEKIYHRNPDCMMVQSNFMYIDENDNQIKRKVNYHGKGKLKGCIPLSTHDICRFAGSGFTMSLRKEVVERVFESGLQKKKDDFEFHDVLLGLMAAAIGKCGYVPGVVDGHRLHSKNATQHAGAIYVADRTREKQIEKLKRKGKRFDMFSFWCKNEEKKKIFKEFSEFVLIRKNYIEKFQFRNLMKLINFRHYYTSEFGLVSDSMYALGMEKLVLFLFSKL